MNIVRALSRIPTALFFAATAWSPIDPFRPKPFEPALYECSSSAEGHSLSLRTCFKDDPFQMAFHWKDRQDESDYRISGYVELCGAETVQFDEKLPRNTTWFRVPHTAHADDSHSFDVTVQAIGDDHEIRTDEAGMIYLSGCGGF